ncbi:hypothetical protein [Streptomyces sp. NPDC018000]|uniref:hypothetical protein n=1 Tax=Streptomyces sp. NPDC018000 TaxID=3365028 RepID=UPI00378C3775
MDGVAPEFALSSFGPALRLPLRVQDGLLLVQVLPALRDFAGLVEGLPLLDAADRGVGEFLVEVPDPLQLCVDREIQQEWKDCANLPFRAAAGSESA